MRIPLVPTLSTFTYLRFEFMADDFRTPEERLRENLQRASYGMLTNAQKKVARHTVMALTGTPSGQSIVGDFLTANFAAMEHRAVAERYVPQDLIVLDGERQPKTIAQILADIERKERSDRAYWAFGRQHGMGVASLVKALKELP